MNSGGKISHEVLTRYDGNPIIELDDMPFRCNTVFNGSPVKINGEYFILLRVEGLQGYSFFALARSGDGFRFEIEPDPVMMPAREGPWRQWESHGIEDPRITLMDGKFYVLYTAVGDYGHCIALAETEDLREYRRLGVISGPGNKDGVLFPEKINGLYARLDRPIGNDIGSIWISYSPDLLNWGLSEVVMEPRPRCWDSYRIGASAPPFLTERGWLEIYHGVKMTSAGPIYRSGAALLERDNPSVVTGRSLIPLQSPRRNYERIGDVGNVVFACGAILEDDGEVKVYYGAADTAICLSTGMLEDILSFCTEEGK